MEIDYYIVLFIKSVLWSVLWYKIQYYQYWKKLQIVITWTETRFLTVCHDSRKATLFHVNKIIRSNECHPRKKLHWIELNKKQRLYLKYLQ